jgi:SNF2 family DNA or RNA helicase
VEAIALILARPSPSSIIKTTLVVAPIALMRQWEKELRHHVLPEHSLQVHVYHGSGTNVDFHKLRKCDVVLTTFGTLAMEFKKFEKRLEEGMRDPNHGLAAKDKLALIGPECEWYRVILDEAQNIKNKSTRSARAAWALRSKYRLCMTGTPMMNSVDELYSLIRFLRIRPYDDFNLFNTQIGKAMR